MGYLIIAKKENRLHFHLKTEQVLRVEVHEEKDVIKKVPMLRLILAKRLY